ncbi:MAG: T9SS type A sorting domain-containing protein [Bacteroidota bacterium]
MKQSLRSFFLLAAVVTSLTAFSQERYGLLTVTGQFFQTMNTAYLQTINNLNSTSYTNAGATEIAGLNYLHTWKGAVYVTNGEQARVDKYTVGSNGALTKSGTLVYPAGSTKDKLVTLLFVSETEAYTYAYGGLILYRFNPSTMKADGQIDLSSLRNTSFNTTTFTSMIKRDDLLYIGVAHFSGFTSVTGPNQAQLAIVNVKENNLVKSIVDQRTLTLGYGNSNVNAFIMDENNDIYVSSSPTYQNSGATKPTGVLRIKNGETEFDASYFFDLYTLMGNRANLGLNYYKNGKAYSTSLYKEKINPLDPFSGATDPIYRYWSIDLAAKTGKEISDLPFTKAYVSSWMQPIDGGKFILPIGVANSDAIWTLDPETNTASKRFSVIGQCFGVFPVSRGISGIFDNNNLSAAFSLYPNPANETLNLSSLPAESALIRVENIAGQLVAEYRTETAVKMLDISAINSGIYLVSILDAQHNILGSRRFIKL